MSIFLFLALASLIGVVTVSILSSTDNLKALPVSMLLLLSLLAYYILSNHIDVKHSTLLWMGIIWIACIVLLGIRIFVEWIEDIPVDDQDNDDWHM